MPIFRERFVADGNVYDIEKQSKFTDADIDTAMEVGSSVITNRKQCTNWARKAYLHGNPACEDAFRAFIGIEAPLSSHKKVRQYT